jgi:hypothetical protein
MPMTKRISATAQSSTALAANVDATTGVITVANPVTNDGWHGLQFYITSNGAELVATNVTSQKKSAGKKAWHADIAPGIGIRIETTPDAGAKGICLQPSVVNRTDQPFHFTGYGFRIADGAAGPMLHHHGLAVFVHSENLRYENLPHSRENFPFIRPLPESHRIYGRQGLAPMPALALGKITRDRWLVEGALSQDRHAPSWHLDLSTIPGRMLEYRSEYFWNGASSEVVAAGETVALEVTLYQIVEAPPDQIYTAYIDALLARYGKQFAGARSRLATEPLYCTWNYGVFTGVDENTCLQRIALAGKTQKGGVFQLDHGYQRAHESHASWGYMDAYYPDSTATWDKNRFPGGPRRIVDACKKAGLRPAIWWTPRMDVGGPISRDHPEWIALNPAGNPIEKVGDLHPDYSVPEVRAFIEQSLRTVIDDWEFEGIKLDFVSWAFDAPDLVYRNGGTSIYWKRWLLRLIRKMLGPGGYFLHCVSCPLGNPFLAIDGCDSFRAGGDIDHGAWELHLYNCGWMLASFPASGKRTWFADMDSFMGNPKFPGNERRFRGAVGYMTSGVINVSGPIEAFNDAAMQEYRLLSERCDQGNPVRVLDRAAFFGRPLPRVLARMHGAGSKTRKSFGVIATIGLFNWDEAPQSIAVALTELGLKWAEVRVRDFWTGKPVPLKTAAFSALLHAREHALLDVMPK